MNREIELSQLNLRYEGYRLRQPSVEARLLSDIAHQGITEPLEGVGDHILLNGFKRYRCARQLNITTVPYVTLGKDEVTGFASLLRTSNNRTLSNITEILGHPSFKEVCRDSTNETGQTMGVPIIFPILVWLK